MILSYIPERRHMDAGTILLMRHAQKPAGNNDPHLATAGKERALKLVQYIPTTFGNPTHLLLQNLPKTATVPLKHFNRFRKILASISTPTSPMTTTRHSQRNFCLTASLRVS